MTEALSVLEDTADRLPTQKELGAYYTPDTLTSILSKWAIRSPNDNIFEPSFGGCGFLQSAVSRLVDLGADHPQNQLYGCDVDPKAFNYLYEKLNALENINQRFLRKDFMETLPQDFMVSSFQAIIGNPPYISLHNLSPAQKKSVEKWQSGQAFKISRRASLWAYFVIHSLSFLEVGGRMAWVLPGSFLDSDYGVQLQEFLLTKFGQVLTFKLGQRVFLTEGTEERTVVLLCEGFGQVSTQVEFEYIETLGELENRLGIGQLDTNTAMGIEEAVDAYEVIASREDVCSLGDLARILIGTVTGANKFFVLKPSQVNELGLEEACTRSILSKFANIESMEVTAKDVAQWRVADKRCVIFHADDESKISIAAKTYADTFDEEEKAENQTFKSRKNWLASDDNRIPDAFLSYMNHHGPRFVLNKALINSTNSIHRVFFKNKTTRTNQKLIAISICTSFSQLSAEIEGRSYGSGVLKLEPSEAKSIKLVLPEGKTRQQIDKAFSNLNALWRKGNLLAIQRAADDFILNGHSEVCQSLSNKLEQMRVQRVRPRA